MPPRIHVVLLGKVNLPQISGDDTLAVFVDGEPAQLLDTPDVARTLEQLRAKFPGAELRCNPELASIGEPLGYVVEPWEPQMLAQRAALAMQVAYAPRFDDVDPGLLASLLRTAARLANAKKDAERFWRLTEKFSGSDGHSRLSLELAAIAATSPNFEHNNLSIFATREDADEYYRSVTPWQGTHPPLRRVTLDLAEPAMSAVQEAVRAYTSCGVVPAVSVVDHGKPGVLTNLECAVLAASTGGLATLSEAPERVDSATTYSATSVTLYTQLHVELNQIASGKYRGSMGWWR
jgi:hypothetical protein